MLRVYNLHVTFFFEKGKRMKHPEWATKHKVKGTELRYIRGKYYLYKITSRWDKEKKVTKKITLGMIGRITEQEGLIAKGESTGRKKVAHQDISVKEYGASNILSDFLGGDIIKKLQSCFPDTWQTITVLALQKLIKQAPLKNMEFHYQESYLSEVYPGLSLSKNSLTSFIAHLSSQEASMKQFKKSMLEGSEHIVFDITHIISQASNMDINLQGYNSKQELEPQVNLFYLFSTDKRMPAYYRILPGNISGMKALKHTIDEAGLTACTLIGDKGFGSQENLAQLEEIGLRYILPLRRNNKKADYSKLQYREYDKAFDGHFFYKDRPIFYTVKKEGERQYLLFTDQQLRTKEEADYLRLIENNHENYDIEGFKQKQLAFGTMFMVTNAPLAPQEIYQLYKSRNEIEVMFDVYKNTLQADSSYMHTEKGFNAWAFLNHIALLLYYRLQRVLSDKDMLKKYSPQDIIKRLERIQKLHIKGKWVTSEINSKTVDVMKKLEIPVP